MAVERTLIEHYAPSSDFARFLQGRYVTEIDDEFDTITLDNGTTLEIEGNEGCAWCRSGWYELINVFKQGTSSARIMSAHVACDIDEESDDESEDRAVDPHVYTLFVMVDGNPGFLPLATIRGDDGGGWLRHRVQDLRERRDLAAFCDAPRPRQRHSRRPLSAHRHDGRRAHLRRTHPPRHARS